jgi:hypothetical protein
MKWRGGLGDWHDLQILVPNLTLNPQFRVDAVQILVPNLTLNPQFRVDAGGQLKL